jgi:hypothetical protein
MPKKTTEAQQQEPIDEAPELQRHTLMKVTDRLHAARNSCLAAAREIEVTINWLDKQKPNKV